MGFNTKEELLAEYAKAYRDTSYALKTYLETYDNTQNKFVPLQLFPDQETLIKNYDNNNENIVIKYRQAGVSTVTAAWASKKLAFASPKKPEKILIVANKLDTATEFATKIKAFLQQWPDWLEVEFDKDKNAAAHYKLKNKSEVKAVGTSKDALRGYTPTILIFDEAAYIEAGDDFWAACMASLSTGGQVIVISTPNGHDEIYYPVYKKTIDGEIDFKISYLYWFTDPRFTKDLKWVKCDDIIHYMLNREKYNDEELVIEEHDVDKFHELMAEGYKPYSSWYEGMCKKLKYDKRKINQEIHSVFLGSGNNVIPPEVITHIKENDLREPKDKYVSGLLWVWKEPIAGHKYIMGIDASSGQSDDYSAITIIDFDEREQVLEYVAKIPPDELADIAYKWATLYSAFIVVDITNGWGGHTARKLQADYHYKNMYYDKLKNEDVWKYDPDKEDKIPGIHFNSKRTQIIAALEEQLRNGFKVRSVRLVNEFDTFVFINGKPDHQKSAHDDAIMAIAMAVYVAETSFSSLEKANNQTKAMLESWVRQDTKTSLPVPNGLPSQHSDPFFLSKSQQFNPWNNNPSAQQYQEYGWLFGMGKKRQ